MVKASQRRMEQNRERITRAALELFQVHGIGKTATNDVARKAAISPATIYNHFGRKEDLVYAAVRHFATSAAAHEIMRKIIAADSSLSKDPEHSRKQLQELIPPYLYGILGKPGK